MKKIGIIGAMETEIEFLRGLMGNEIKKTEAGTIVFNEGKIHGTDVVVVRSGVGKVNAALCAQRLALQFGCSNIINTGVAGAMAQGLGVMDFVVSTDAVYHDMDATGFGYKVTEIPQMKCSDFIADKKLIEAAEKSFSSIKEAEGHSLIKGRIATGDQFISDKSIKEKIMENCNPACVEMEGTAIAHACYLNDTPFVIIRCMSDMADDSGENTYSFNENTAASLSGQLVLEMLKHI
jgi:adenosylhomocysteine nucleosidase